MRLLVALVWAVGGLLLHPAGATTRVRLEATVRDDLQTVVGEVWVEDPDGLRLEDALSRLPMPSDDLEERRTFPGRAEQGWVHIEPVADGEWSFHSILPRRYGAAGRVPRRGLFANGLWHPQPTRGGRLPVVEWEVRVHLPPGTTGVLNGEIGADLLTWTGSAERLALAVLPRARVETIPLEAGELVLVDQGPRRSERDDRLAAVLTDAWPGPGAPRVVVVEAPLRRRLVRAGPGVLFLSDRAYRLTDGLAVYHSPAVRRGLLEAGLPMVDPWLRSFVAATYADHAARHDPDPRELLGWFSWIPQVDSLLYDGQMPFFSDTFDEVWQSDTIRDDLQEVLAPGSPGRPVARRLDARYGEGTAQRLSWWILQGRDPETAAHDLGVPWSDILAWRAPPSPTDLHVAVEPSGEGWRVDIVREAPPDAPTEPIEYTIDGSRSTWLASPGPSREVRQLPERPETVRVDPDHEVLQVDRSNDSWPRHWTAVASFFPYEITLRTARISASAAVGLRPRYGTRWMYSASIATTPENIAAGAATVYHYLGPLQDRRSRPFRLWLGGGPAVLDPDYRPTDHGALALGAYAGAAWETRVDPDFPRRGHRLWLGGSAGWVPGGDRWGAASTGGILLVPVGGRMVSASKLKAGVADGGVQHRLLALGGSDNVQGLPAGAVVGDRKLIGATELRWQVVRHASLPLPLLWLSDVQLSGGVDAGTLGERDQVWSAVGWTGGIAFTGELFGARPTMLGAWAAGTLWTDPVELGEDPWPEIYVRMTQPF